MRAVLSHKQKTPRCGVVNHTIIPTGSIIGLGVDLILLSLSKLAK